MPKVTFITEKNEKKVIEVPPGANLRQEARKNGIKLSSRVIVKSGAQNLGPAGAWEKANMLVNPFAFFSRIGHESDLRLASQCQVNGDCEVQAQSSLNWSGEKFWE